MNKAKRKAAARSTKRLISRYQKMKKLQVQVYGQEISWDEQYTYRFKARRRFVLEQQRVRGRRVRRDATHDLRL